MLPHPLPLGSGAGWTPPGPAFKKKTCNLDDHHGPLVGAADVHGGFYVEGVNGVINSERDLTSGKRADDGTWEVGIEYNHGQMVLCTGMFCSAESLVTPYPLYVTAHTCAAIRFTYAPNSSSTVYELPNQQALDSCDFSHAILRGDEAAGSPHFDVLIDYDHDKTVYFYASRVGCTDGQKVAVNVVEDHESNFAQCEGMGAGSSRIRHCDCNHQLKPSTLIDPCHTAFVYGCLRDMPDDLSCCPDETVTYDDVTQKYVNATGGSHNTGTCTSKSKVASNLENVPILKDLRTSDPDRVSGFNAGPCVRYSFQAGYDPMCQFHKVITKCDVEAKPYECQFDPAWIAWTTWTPPSNNPPPPPTPMSFVDDVGVKHTWTKAQPKIVAGTFDAIALLHMGMDPSQIIGTHGERGTSGSNVNGYYHDGNLADHGDHASAPYDRANFPMDPTAEERTMLAAMLDLSPGCSATNFYCTDFDQTILDANGWPDLIIEGAYHGPYYNSPELEAAAAAKGIPIIRLLNPYSANEDIPTQSFIQMTHRYEELARALGVSDVSEATADDKAALCDEIAAFKPVALAAQRQGVRALAGYLPYGAASPNGNIGGFLGTPDEDSVLLMLEELGMPIMHTDSPFGYYWENMGDPVTWQPSDEHGMSATNLMSTGGRTSGRVKVPYPVDFWLYDSRVTLDFKSDSFAAAWPHPAVVAGQYASWKAEGGIYSYRHAVSILANVREKLAVAQNLHPELESACTEVRDEHEQGGGSAGGHGRRLSSSSPINLGPGQYACYNPVSYAMCEPKPVDPLVVTVTASGSVGDYADTSALRSKFAAAAGVSANLVSIKVSAGSVVITATIARLVSPSPLLDARLRSTLGSAASASAALGITIESDPVISGASTPGASTPSPSPAPSPLSSPPPPSPLSSPPPPSPPPPSPPIWPNTQGTGTIASTESNIEGSDMDDGEIAGVAVGCLIVGLLIGGGVVFLRFKWSPIVKRHKSFEVDLAERKKEEEKGMRTENV